MNRSACRLLTSVYTVSARILPSRTLQTEHRNLIDSVSADGSYNYIAGEAKKGGGEEIANIYPATGETLYSYREASQHDVDLAVDAASKATEQWQETPIEERAAFLRRVGAGIRARRLEIATAESLDVGKSLWESQMDVDNCADLFEYYAGLGPLLNGEYCPQGGGSAWYTRREALGVCGAIGAWNYPFQMATLKSAPAMLCGNSVVFKPAPATPTTARILAEIMTAVGAPKGLFNVVLGGGDTGTTLCEHQGVDKLSFTGSTATGSRVMRAASERTIPVTLELGGNAAMIVCEDAVMEDAVKGALLGNFLTQGQVCSNAARVFVHDSLFSNFTEQLLNAIRRLKVGDPFAPDTTIGPMISDSHGRRVLDLVRSAEKEGATMLIGGQRLQMDGNLAGGFFLPPTVISDCHDGMTVVKEEIFGPVLTLLSFRDEEEAVRRANDTEFGLAGGVFTRDIGRATRIASKLKAGSLYVNTFHIVPIGIPFGGYRRSGMGRENAAMETLSAYSQVKSVYVEGGSVILPFPE